MLFITVSIQLRGYFKEINLLDKTDKYWLKQATKYYWKAQYC